LSYSTIARALANDPELLLLDEPTGDLDTKNTIEVMDLLMGINLKRKTTCVMVSHNPDVECYADRVIYLEDGRFVKQALNATQTPLIYEYYIQYVNNQKATLEEGDPAYESEKPSSSDAPPARGVKA
jgi:putative ABC transport system ATP-binding protein